MKNSEFNVVKHWKRTSLTTPSVLGRYYASVKTL